MKNNKIKMASLVLLSSLIMSSFSTNKENNDVDTEVKNTNEYVYTKEDNQIELEYDINKYGYMLYDTSIYKDPIDFKEIGLIDKYQKVYVIGYYKGYDKVVYELNGGSKIIGYVPASWINIIDELFIDIDISEQKIKMYQDNKEILNSNTVTGKKNESPTREGFFDIYHKEKNATLRGYNTNGTMYASFVDYWMPFDGGIGLHDAEYHNCSNGSHGWRDSSTFGHDTYIYGGSHGCVNLLNDTAKFIYDNSEVGTKVLVHK